MNILSITDLTKAYGPRTILDGVSLGLDQGDRVGLIGDNGTGKSTLLRIIIGEEPPDGGVMALRGGTRVGFLAQVPILPAEDTVRAHLSELFAEVPRAIERYEAAATAMDPEADRWFNEIERLGGWDWSYRVEQVASLLNVASFLERPLGTLSGGQKKRVALARLILSAPDLILMDEPTNHLDADTVEWLEQWIAASPATFIIVTHDRYFLENAVTRMAELRDAQLRIYDGAYSDYLTARAEDEALRERTAKRRQNILKEELEWARRSPQARTTKSRSRLDRVDALAEDVERLTATRRLSDFTAGSAPRLGKTVLELVHVTKGYEETGVLVDDLTLMLRKGDRYGVIGANGSGKTTLMRLVLGELLPDAGTVKPGTQTQFAYFDQHRALLLDLDKTVKETVCQDGDKVFPGGRPQHYASWLERFAFGSEQHRQKVERLSGGERNRLALARFLLEEANFLVLDEPTNDLDLMTMHVLEEALLAFEGCVLVVSHDRYFLDRVATGVIAFERDGADGAPGGRPLVVQGDYTTYKRLRAQNERARVEVARADVAAGKAADKAARAAATAPAEPKRATGGAKRGLSWAETRELAAIEPAIEAHEGRLAELEAGLADPALWQDGGERGLALERDRAELKATIDAAYARWAALTEKRDG